MDSREERIEDYRRRADADIRTVLREYGITPEENDDGYFYDSLVEALVECQMHPIEHLVLELTT